MRPAVDLGYVLGTTGLLPCPAAQAGLLQMRAAWDFSHRYQDLHQSPLRTASMLMQTTSIDLEHRNYVLATAAPFHMACLL